MGDRDEASGAPRTARDEGGVSRGGIGGGGAGASGEGAGRATRRLGRFEALDKRPVNLDGFAQRDDEAGLVAFASANDPEPSVALDARGRVTELDGRAAADFDIIDAFIAAHGLDLVVAEEAMAVDDVAFARMIVDPGTPRAEVVRLAAGMTPAKLARVLALLRPVELLMAMTKMRARRTPSNQAHVTNRSDDPLLLAADAATAAAFGFREIETTVPVLGDAPSNAIAVSIGAPVGARVRSCSAPSRRRSSSRWGCAASCPTPRPCRCTAPSRSSSTATTPRGPRRS